MNKPSVLLFNETVMCKRRDTQQQILLYCDLFMLISSLLREALMQKLAVMQLNRPGHHTRAVDSNMRWIYTK